MTTLLDIRNIQCRYQDNTVIEDLSLHIHPGTLACLLGPSGCGKTTALRAIAGFEDVHHGEIRLRGETVSRPGFSLAPERRRLAMVFQDYALFPHLDVATNITFGLRDTDSAGKKRVADEMLDIVDLAGFGQRYPHELSGGQQQRVALARALAGKPDLILFDEPFSNLDVDLRERLVSDVRDLLKEHGIAGVLVTHDQHEAFALADQVGVMHQGRIEQWDTPFNLYHDPVNRFVADFIGQGVFLRGTMRSPESVDTELGIISGDRAYKWPVGTDVELLIRPDDIVPYPGSPMKGKVQQRAFKGAQTLYTLETPAGTRLLSLMPSHYDYPIGESVEFQLGIEHLVLFPA